MDDPNQHVAKMRFLCGKLMQQRIGLLRRVDVGEELARLFIDLDLHLVHGGKTPSRWQKKKGLRRDA